jgi:ATP-dependent helicase/DNAse subunit B
MTAVVEVLTNVARTGKTSHLLSLYREALRRSVEQVDLGTTLWLTPTNRARRWVLGQLLDDSLTACFAPNVFTFDGFAERILQLSERSVAPLTGVARRILIRGIIDDLRQEGRIPYFARIAETSGFVELVIGFISELKRAETWPEHFAVACRTRGESDKDRELVLIYRRYQELLTELGRYDEEGRFWSARTEIAEGGLDSFGSLNLVVADGFTDFTHTQYEILGHLAATAEKLVISLPLEAPLARSDLFAKSATALARIKESARSGDRCLVDDASRRATVDRPAFVHIADWLFANPRRHPRLSQADGVEVVAATGQLGEVEMIARRVKRLLLAGAKPEEIVVAFRSAVDYADLVDEVFSAAGIPFWNAAGDRLSQTGLIRSLFAVLKLEEEDWQSDRLMSVLDSNYFRPDWQEAGGDQAVRAVAALLRRLQFDAGRKLMLKTLERAVQRTAEESLNSEAAADSASEKGRENAAVAFALLNKLSSATAPLRQRSDFAGWVEKLLSLATQLGIVPDENCPTDAADDVVSWDLDRRTWEAFVGMLDDAVEAAGWQSAGLPLFDLGRFARQLRDLLDTQLRPPLQDEAGRVLVLDAVQVRNLEIPYLFLAGLSETSFPRSQNNDCLYNESERRQLNENGLALGQQSSRSQDEMLLFYGVVTRARRQLVLSYPAVSAGGQPLFSSPFLPVLMGLFEPDALRLEHVGRLDPVPLPEQIVTAADFRLIATADARERKPALFRTLAEQPAMAATARNILAATEMAAARFQTRDFTPFEGLLGEPALISQLGQRYPAEYEFSATQLESYAGCPHRFFLSDVLKIRPLEVGMRGTDLRIRGIVVHAVLANLHRQLSENGSVGTGNSAAEITQKFRKLAREQLQRQADSTDFQQALLEIELWLLNEWAAAYGEQWSAYVGQFAELWDAGPVPHLFEAAFGNAPDEGDDTPEPACGPLTFGSGDKETRMQGRIDRIDEGWSGDQRILNVIDYKTGRSARFSLDDVRSGLAIQLPLYALAARRMNLAGAERVIYQMAYWRIRESGFLTGLKTRSRKLGRLDQETFKELETILEELLPRLAAGIRAGKFPVFSQDVECTSRCPYSSVCRVNQIRPLEQALNKRAEV